ncbi:hypothetical protein CF328_g9377 [Tilletia controversa]|nr:hypothetical protein CF328_g9377 [Tilletia controversa]
MARIRSAIASDLPSSPGSMTLPSSASIVPLHMAVRLPLRPIVGSPPPDSQHNLPSSGLGSSHYQSCAPPLPGKAPAPASFDVALDRLRAILYHLRGPSPPYAPHSLSAIVGSGAPRVFSGGHITSATWTPVPPPTGVCCASLLQHLVGYLGCSSIAHRFGPCAWNR